jgi:hypothetical protein
VGNAEAIPEFIRNPKQPFRRLPPEPIGGVMKDFPDAAFAPEAIEVMAKALDESVAALPHPVTSGQVNMLAESILRTAQTGERDASTLQRLALLELTLTERV